MKNLKKYLKNAFFSDTWCKEIDVKMSFGLDLMFNV